MMKLPALHLSINAQPTSTHSDAAVSTSPQTTHATCALRANGQTPLLIRPPHTAAAYTSCNGALHAAAVALDAGRMQAPLRPLESSLLSNDTYRCIKGKGAEPRYYLTEPNCRHRRA